MKAPAYIDRIQKVCFTLAIEPRDEVEPVTKGKPGIHIIPEMRQVHLLYGQPLHEFGLADTFIFVRRLK